MWALHTGGRMVADGCRGCRKVAGGDAAGGRRHAGVREEGGGGVSTRQGRRWPARRSLTEAACTHRIERRFPSPAIDPGITAAQSEDSRCGGSMDRAARSAVRSSSASDHTRTDATPLLDVADHGGASSLAASAATGTKLAGLPPFPPLRLAAFIPAPPSAGGACSSGATPRGCNAGDAR
jgi:hypothetical protein